MVKSTSFASGCPMAVKFLRFHILPIFNMLFLFNECFTEGNRIFLAKKQDIWSVMDTSYDDVEGEEGSGGRKEEMWFVLFFIPQ